MEINKEKSKILIMGLDNAGKTSIILSMQKDTNIMSFFRLNPTKGIKRINFEDFATKFNVWDFGGQEQFRNDYILSMHKHLEGTKKFIYVIDIQDDDRYEISLEYLKQILESLKILKDTINISVFFHKFDPNLTTDETLNKNASDLIKKIKDLNQIGFKMNFFNTSIFTIFDKVEAEE